MVRHTRRRALGLLIAACAGARLMPLQRAIAAEEDTEATDETEGTEETEEVECYDSKAFGAWKAEASDKSAGASMNEVPPLKACDLTMEIQVNSKFEARIFVTGDPDKTPLPEEFLVKAENRLIAKAADGTVAVDEPLCGNCTDIYDDAVSIVLPLATAPLFREEKSVELAIRLAGKDEDCRFKIDTVTMRKALDWAEARRDALAKQLTDDECVSPEGCFITTACCEVLGLGDDCFELRTLRRYRDEVLAKAPGGEAAIARYYAMAPQILARLPAATRDARLSLVYACYILPSAIAARLGFDALAYRIYVRMLNELAPEMPDMTTGAGCGLRPLPRT
ncbi:MAG: CFI-box-CTERM domain-containing protein [Methyloceanibacter sp.]|uniref:CFI-box-CTERM domain-containing protein n=1 Tax=Methyloceanibacter sp. TaxID=1965321 RepID=UPI003D6D95CE